MSEHLTPGRWDVARRPNRKELAQTSVLALSLDEASVKVRTGPPKDEPGDMDREVWAGVLPVRQAWGEPVPDPAMDTGAAVPVDGVRR
ncbi:MAG: hypothetical protein ACRDN9_17855 [Streptosporangiaceae bacterium]